MLVLTNGVTWSVIETNVFLSSANAGVNIQREWALRNALKF